MRICIFLALNCIIATVALVSGEAWHGGTPHKRYHSPSCALAPPHGKSDCSAGPWCSITPNLKSLAERGAKVPAAIPDNFEHNCTHLTSGCKIDGVGSQMQGKLSAYAYAQAKGMVYVHFPMVHSHGHFSSEAEEVRMVSELEGFFNLGLGEMSLAEAASKNVVPCAVENCHVFMDLGGESCYDNIKTEIRRKYDSTPKPAPLHHTSMITVVVHVRRGDVVQEAGRVQPHYDLRYSPDQYYIDTLAAIKRSLPLKLLRKLDIVVLSEGDSSDFDAIMKAHPTARLVLSGDLLQSIHTMVTADILVMAHSSFSFVAALYNTGIVVYNHFWHSPPKAWFKNPWPPHNATSGVEADTPCKLLMHRLNTSTSHTFLENRWYSRNPQL